MDSSTTTEREENRTDGRVKPDIFDDPRQFLKLYMVVMIINMLKLLLELLKSVK